LGACRWRTAGHLAAAAQCGRSAPVLQLVGAADGATKTISVWVGRGVIQWKAWGARR
jgi:hypothetical protein